MITIKDKHHDNEFKEV